MPANKERHALYGGEIQIDFYPDSHRYKMANDKTYLVSVTGATGILDKPALIPWAVNLDINHIKAYMEERAGQKFTLEELEPIIEEARNIHTVRKEEAASYGDIVHNYAQDFAQAIINGSEQPEINPEWPEEALQGISAFLEWFNAHEVHFHATEKLLYSKEWNIVGKADAVASVDGEHFLIDYKTSKGVWPEHYYQAAAYRKMWNEEHGKELNLTGSKILHFNKEDGQFKAIDVPHLELATELFRNLAQSKHLLKEFSKLTGKY